MPAMWELAVFAGGEEPASPDPTRVAGHVAVAAANALMQAPGTGLNLLGIARKGAQACQA